MKRLMTHLVVGSPNLAVTERLMREMANRNIAAIELQIPFSDPIADGPVLMAANDIAVKNNIYAEDTLRLLKTPELGATKCYVMSYFQPILHYGPEVFFRQALASGCSGFIIPDMPFDAPEMSELLGALPELKQKIVPVLSPGMTDERLRRLFRVLEPELVYLTARHGVTGERTGASKDLQRTIAAIRTQTDAVIAVGFGIQTPTDVKNILKYADIAVVGSALTQALNRSETQAVALLDSLTSVG